MWEKKKMMVTSIFSFSHNVLKKPFPPVRQKSSLCGNGLTAEVTSWRSMTYMCFLAFSHLNRVSNSQPPGHDFDRLTTEPPGRYCSCLRHSRWILRIRNDSIMAICIVKHILWMTLNTLYQSMVHLVSKPY